MWEWNHPGVGERESGRAPRQHPCLRKGRREERMEQTTRGHRGGQHRGQGRVLPQKVRKRMSGRKEESIENSKVSTGFGSCGVFDDHQESGFRGGLDTEPACRDG